MQHCETRFLRCPPLLQIITIVCTSMLTFLMINTNSHATELQPAELDHNISVNNKIGTTSVVGETAVASQSKGSESEPRKPDWNGVLRDTSIVFGAQLAAVGITYFMPESFSAWTPEQKKAGWQKYKDNFTNPVLDKDKFYVNYTLHPYWGATYYTRGRERGMYQSESFVYYALLSAM